MEHHHRADPLITDSVMRDPMVANGDRHCCQWNTAIGANGDHRWQIIGTTVGTSSPMAPLENP